jgi:tRNA(Ile)-lysidine synthase
MDALQKISTSKTKFNFAAGIKPGSTIIIGLSGGPDSVYLLHTLISIKESLGLSLIAAHLDHEWRSSSHDDVIFCQKLCSQLTIPFVTKKGSELRHQTSLKLGHDLQDYEGKVESFKANGSQEQLGRNMRRFFLEQVRKEYNGHAIALAHHQDDQLETFFINLIRGTTITGLCGMKSVEGYFIRPLLGITKSEILTYLSEQQIPYQTDPTNISDAYLRNRIRSAAIPALAGCDARAKTNLVRAMHNIQDTEQFLKKLTHEALDNVTLSNNSSISSLDLKQFFTLDPYLQKRVLFLWLSTNTNGTCRSSEAFLDEVLRFLSSPCGGTHQISPSLKLVKKKMTASITRIAKKPAL